ncbi:uncharacterized protein G2W53_015638 [Senna tora]|uniref:Uncharacterized protein n=1 Tax=Senna tora TaxID=362788 RepID=A0A834WVY8_9FABA|nr:uncharacterized protein G2W53_015638 [Senna tora]
MTSSTTLSEGLPHRHHRCEEGGKRQNGGSAWEIMVTSVMKEEGSSRGGGLMREVSTMAMTEEEMKTRRYSGRKEEKEAASKEDLPLEEAAGGEAMAENSCFLSSHKIVLSIIYAAAVDRKLFAHHPPNPTRIFPLGLDLEAPPCLPQCTHPDCRRQNNSVFAGDVAGPPGIQRSGEILYLFNRDFLSFLGASTSRGFEFDAFGLTLSNPTRADLFEFWATPETDLRLWLAERI